MPSTTYPPSPSLPYGIRWENDNFWGDSVEFSVDPDVNVINRLARHHLNLSPEGKCDACFLAEGALNKVYKVETDENTYIFRVALPLELPYRVESEVATLSFIRQHTDAPIPQVIAYDTTNDNQLRFPWILMEYIPAQPLTFERWATLSWEKKVILVKQLAKFQAQVYHHSFNAIGSLHIRSINDSRNAYLTGWSPAVFLLLVIWLPIMAASQLLVYLFTQHLTTSSDDHVLDDIYLGRMVSAEFALVKGAEKLSHGPFDTAADWLGTRLRGAGERRGEGERVFLEEHPEIAEEEPVNAPSSSSHCDRLLALVDQIFSRPDDVSEIMILDIHDIHDGNILLDEQGHLVGLIDFEYVCTTPKWHACRPPKLLNWYKFQPEPPKEEEYAYTYSESGVKVVNKLYYRNLSDWERMELSGVFVKEMERLIPEWKTLYTNGRSKREFLRLVSGAEEGYGLDHHSQCEWLELGEEGRFSSAHKVFCRKESAKGWAESYGEVPDDEVYRCDNGL